MHLHTDMHMYVCVCVCVRVCVWQGTSLGRTRKLCSFVQLNANEAESVVWRSCPSNVLQSRHLRLSDAARECVLGRGSERAFDLSWLITSGEPEKGPKCFRLPQMFGCFALCWGRNTLFCRRNDGGSDDEGRQICVPRARTTSNGDFGTQAITIHKQIATLDHVCDMYGTR